MKKRIKLPKCFKLIKNFKEKMSEAEKSYSSSDTKEEEYSWVFDSNLNNNALRYLYIQFPFDEWEQIIDKNFDLNHVDEKKIYQEIVNKVLEIDIFKNQKFEKEINGTDMFKKFVEKLGINLKEIKNDENIDIANIKPDFSVITMEKKEFIALIQNRTYMFRSGIHLKSLDDNKNILYINIIGEIKLNPNHIDKKQRNRYFEFCKYMNSKDSNHYYLTLYIFNVSYPKFWAKNFHNNNPCIIGFIPKLHSKKRDYILHYSYLVRRRDEIIDTYEKSNVNNENNIINKSLKNDNILFESSSKQIIKKTIEKKMIEKESENKNNDYDYKKDEIIEIINIKDDNGEEIMEKNPNNKESEKIIVTKEMLIQKQRITENRIIAINRNIEDIKQEKNEEIEKSNKFIKNKTENINKIINYLENILNELIKKEKDNLKFEIRKYDDKILNKKRKLEDYELEAKRIKKEIIKKSKDN